MKKLFYTAIIGLLLFEILNIYFIMPIPGSQRMNSIDVAYFLYSWRWVFRLFFSLLLLISFLKTDWKRKWIPLTVLIVLSPFIYIINFKMSADHMFSKVKQLIMVDAASNKVGASRLVIGVEKNGFAKAYPIQFLGYHHQVFDSLNGEPIIVTYCTVCRTGRVYEPKVKGTIEKFRLVGMDHFNAMFEDATTQSWWRQVTGEAIAGKLKGEHLPEIYSTQTSCSEWLLLHPKSLIMQADTSFIDYYSSTEDYETGKSKSELTGTNGASWKDKSWVIGIEINQQSKAYDWNKLVTQRIIHDKIGDTPVLLLLATDNKSFFAFERNSNTDQFRLINDTLVQSNQHYKLDGTAMGTFASLKTIFACQEFWHSWRTFHPATKVY